MERFSRYLTLSGGTVAQQGSVSVYLAGTTTFASIYKDKNRTQPITQPFTVNHTTGEIGFYAPNGLYDVVVSGLVGNESISFTGVSLNDPNDLAAVATSGSYNDLVNKPTIPAAQVNSDWNASSGAAQILNKPTLFSGSYMDLTNKPSLFSGSYTDLTNKPSLFSGSYTDLTNKPTIPAAQVNSDWNAVSGVTQILNKPTIPTVPSIWANPVQMTTASVDTSTVPFSINTDYTVGTPQRANYREIISDANGWFISDAGCSFAVLVYAIRTVDGVDVFSPNPATIYFSDNTDYDPSVYWYAHLQWDAVPNATKYRLMIQNDDYQGWYSDHYIDVYTNSFDYGYATDGSHAWDGTADYADLGVPFVWPFVCTPTHYGANINIDKATGKLTSLYDAQFNNLIANAMTLNSPLTAGGFTTTGNSSFGAITAKGATFQPTNNSYSVGMIPTTQSYSWPPYPFSIGNGQQSGNGYVWTIGPGDLGVPQVSSALFWGNGRYMGGIGSVGTYYDLAIATGKTGQGSEPVPRLWFGGGSASTLSMFMNSDVSVVNPTTFGAEIITNPTTFNSTYWSLTGDAAFSANTIVFTKATGFATVKQTKANMVGGGSGLIAGRWYWVTITSPAPSGASVNINNTFGTDPHGQAVGRSLYSGNTTFLVQAPATTGDLTITVLMGVANTFTITGISVKEVTGGNITAYGSITTSGSVTAKSVTCGSCTWFTGTGSPEGVVMAPIGSLYTRTDGGTNTTLYVKQSGTGNTGWAAK